MTESNARSRWECKRCFIVWNTELSTPPENCVCCTSTEWSNPRPMQYSNSDQDRDLILNSYHILHDAVCQLWDRYKDCRESLEPVPDFRSESPQAFSKFCDKTESLEMAVSKVMIETLSILGTLMDVGIFDQHDPFNCRKEGYSIWPAYRYKDA